jgi:hypothetical protein
LRRLAASQRPLSNGGKTVMIAMILYRDGGILDILVLQIRLDDLNLITILHRVLELPV